ncbi:MAG: hypothetical protein U1F35_03405 [Steroidobacteraceae bacterium]
MPLPCEAWQGPATHLLDLHGATVLPGLHDVHVHPLFGGMLQKQCLIEQGATLAKPGPPA